MFGEPESLLYVSVEMVEGEQTTSTTQVQMSSCGFAGHIQNQNLCHEIMEERRLDKHSK